MACHIHSVTFLLLSAIDSVKASHCSVHTDCASCVQDGTFLPCRWCPVDERCHDPGAVATNPCSKEQNVVDPTKCSTADIPEYDEGKAKAMLTFSAAAYADDSQGCLNKLPGGTGYTIFANKSVPCPAGMTLSENVSCKAYAAMSTTDKRIVLAYRGSVDAEQIKAEAVESLANYADYITFGSMEVGKYWADVYNSLKDVPDAVLSKAKECAGCEVWVTGHSLGGAIASIAAAELGLQGVKISQYTFGQPRVGLYSYVKSHDALVVDSYRIINADDIVPHTPWCRHVKYDGWLPLPVCASWGGAALPNWYHHGTEIYYQSPAMPAGGFKVCHGVPHNEDLTTPCADTLYATDELVPSAEKIELAVQHHMTYFGVHVGAACDSEGGDATSTNLVV